RDLIPFVSRFYLYFFFSSRRRHTRCYRDWSSDVCSSDLVSFASIKLDSMVALDFLGLVLAKLTHDVVSLRFLLFAMVGGTGLVRSEERRVGEEWKKDWCVSQAGIKDTELVTGSKTRVL